MQDIRSVDKPVQRAFPEMDNGRISPTTSNMPKNLEKGQIEFGARMGQAALIASGVAGILLQPQFAAGYTKYVAKAGQALGNTLFNTIAPGAASAFAYSVGNATKYAAAIAAAKAANYVFEKTQDTIQGNPEYLNTFAVIDGGADVWSGQGRRIALGVLKIDHGLKYFYDKDDADNREIGHGYTPDLNPKTNIEIAMGGLPHQNMDIAADMKHMGARSLGSPEDSSYSPYYSGGIYPYLIFP